MHPFADYLIGLGLSPKTVAIYVRSALAAITWLRSNGVTDLATVSASLLATYAATLPQSASTRRQLRSSLRHWSDWQGLNWPVAAIRVPPKPRPMCRAITPSDATAVVKASLGWYPQGTAVLLGFYLALRRDEIARFQWSRLRGDWYTVTGKGERTASLPVHPVLVDELSHLRRSGDWLFPGSRGRSHVTGATIWNWVNEVADAAGVPRFTPHQMRHTALATMNDATGDLRATQEFARHSRPETTAIYTRATGERLERAMLALDYL